MDQETTKSNGQGKAHTGLGDVSRFADFGIDIESEGKIGEVLCAPELRDVEVGSRVVVERGGRGSRAASTDQKRTGSSSPRTPVRYLADWLRPDHR